MSLRTNAPKIYHICGKTRFFWSCDEVTGGGDRDEESCQRPASQVQSYHFSMRISALVVPRISEALKNNFMDLHEVQDFPQTVKLNSY